MAATAASTTRLIWSPSLSVHSCDFLSVVVEAPPPWITCTGLAPMALTHALPGGAARRCTYGLG